MGFQKLQDYMFFCRLLTPRAIPAWFMPYLASCPASVTIIRSGPSSLSICKITVPYSLPCISVPVLRQDRMSIGRSIRQYCNAGTAIQFLLIRRGVVRTRVIASDREFKLKGHQTLHLRPGRSLLIHLKVPVSKNG